MPSPLLVEAIHLRKSYGDRLAVDDLSFTINAGEVAGLLGPNGAGKTTTLSMLATLLVPDAGEIRIAGFDSRRDPKSLRRKLGFVPQSIALYPSLSAYRNLEIFARIHGLPRPEARARCLDALDAVGLRDRADDAVWTLTYSVRSRMVEKPCRSRDCRSTPTVGSSRAAASGCSTMPQARFSRRFMPPERAAKLHHRRDRAALIESIEAAGSGLAGANHGRAQRSPTYALSDGYRAMD